MMFNKLWRLFKREKLVEGNKPPKVEIEQMYRLKNADDDTVGIDAHIVVENGKVVMDFTKPIQWLTMNSDDTQRMIKSLILAGHAAFGDDAPKELPKPN